MYTSYFYTFAVFVPQIISSRKFARKSIALVLIGIFVAQPLSLVAAQEVPASSETSDSTNNSAPVEAQSTYAESGDQLQQQESEVSEGTEQPQSLMDSGETYDPPTISNPNLFTSKSKLPSIDASGALIHQLTLDIPPGRNGLTPDVTLSYNSQQLEDGVVGYGWSLSIPYIERLNKTGIENLYIDDYFTSSMGGELVETETSGEYRHRIDDGSFIDFEYANNSWVAYDKKGTKYTFGATTTAQLFATTTPSNVHRWMLEEIRDTNNNYVTYQYLRDTNTNQIYPHKITYTGHNTTDGIFTVDFTRTSRTDPIISYKSGFRVETRDRISEIKATVNGSWVRKYALSYTTGQNGFRSLLSSVQETGRDDSATELTLPATNFMYASTTPGYASASNPDTKNGARVIADSDGNGLPDSNVFYLDPGPYTLKDIKKNNYPTFTNITGSVIDYWSENISGWFSQYRYVERGSRFFDANGDGKADILRSMNESSGAKTRAYYQNQSDYNVYDWVDTPSWSGSIPMFTYYHSGNYYASGIFGNVNGDGLVDYVISLPTISSNQGSDGAYLHIGTSSPAWSLFAGGYTPIADMPTDPATTTANELVDINGDGLDDWMTATASSTKFCLNTGSGWDSACSTAWNIATSTRQTGGWDRGIRFTDWNGDGLPDYVRSYTMPTYSSALVANIEKGTYNYVYLNTGSGWATTTYQLPENIFTGSLDGSDWTGRIVYNELIDWNGDGTPDQNEHTSTTTKPDLLQKITYPTFGSSEMEYNFSSQTGGNRNLAFPILLVTKITNRDNLGGAESTTYEYAGGKTYLSADMRDRRFAGFATTTRRDSLGITQTFYHQNDTINTAAGEQIDAFSLMGKPYREDVLTLASSTIKKTFYRWNVVEYGATATSSSNSHSLDVEVSSNQYTSIADGSQTGLDFSNDFTLSAWVKFESLQGSDDDIIIAKRQATGNNRSYTFFSGGSGVEELTLVWWHDGSSSYDIEKVTWTPSTGTWYHVAVAKTGTQVKFYVNGSQQGSTQTGTSGTVYNGSADFRIAADQDDAADDFDGLVDDVRVWSRELSSTEISNLYSGPHSFSNGSNLQGWWKFDNNYNDDSVNGNHVTGQGSPVFSSTVAFTGSATTTGANRWFVHKSAEMVQDFEGAASHKDKAIEYSYSTSTGNLLQTTEKGEVTGSSDGTFSDTGSDTRTTIFTYSTTTALNMSLPSSKKVKNNSGTVVQEVKFYYDAQPFGSTTKGNPTKEENWISGNTYASTTKTYTTYGLVSTSVDPRGYTTTYTYDSHNLYPATTTNALSHTTEILYDYAKGAARQITDANGLVKTYTFDPVGRVTEEKQPDLTTPSTLVTSKTYAYTDTFPTNVRTRAYMTSATTTDMYAYRDGLGRPLQDRSQVAGNNTYAVKDYVYDSAGQLSRESLPYFASSTDRTAALAISSPLYIVHNYDPLRRATSTVTSVGTTLYTYTPWKTRVTDANGNPKDMLRDAYDNLAMVVEYNDTEAATTTYAYDALQNLTSITDGLANVRNFTYDGLSRRTMAQDLHDTADSTFGTWTYGYDLAGNVSSTTDPKAQVVNYTYDALNRATAEDYIGSGGTEVTYLYDFCTYGKGRICTASSTEAFTSTAYNSLGLASAERRVINGTAYASTTFSYDRVGNPTTIVYPDGREVVYGYDLGGKVADIKTRPSAGATSDILSKVEYAPHGLVSLRAYGNGIDTPYAYLQNQLYRLNSIGKAASSTELNSHALDLESSSSQYLSISDASQSGLDLSNDLSLSMWVKLESFSTNDTLPLVVKRNGTGNQRSYSWYLMDLSGTKTMNFDYSSTGSDGTDEAVSWTPSLGVWYHIAVVKDDNQVKFFVDGVQQGSTQTGSITNIYNSSSPVEVGGWINEGSPVGYVDGKIDDVRIWSRAVSDSDISTLANTPESALNGANLQAWWKLNTSYEDASGNGNTVVAQNSPVFSSDTPYLYESGSGAGGIQYLRYGYDAVGNITSITDTSTTSAAKTVVFTYDDLNRLVSASTTIPTSNPYREEYRYNMLGNLLYKGTNVGTTTVAVNNSHSLDLEVSSNQYASITDGSQTGLDFSDALTLSAWVKFESLQSSDDDILIAKRNAAGNNRSYSFYSTGSGSENLTLTWWTNGSTQFDIESVAWSPSVDTWYHVAVTKDGTSVKFYVNGSQQGSTQTGTNGGIYNGTAEFRIGADQDDAADDFDGKLDDVRVWSRELSSTEISNLYSAPGTFSNGANLQGAWQFDNAYTDASGNGNTLTGYNSPVFSTNTAYASSSSSFISDGDTYAYSETNYANPHALTAIWNGYATSTLVYDANGNLTQYGTTTAYTYDYRNRMTATGISGATTTYGYDHTTNRIRMTTPTQTTHYINKYFSKTGATTTAYIWHGDTMVGYIDSTGTATTTYFAHPDHLGSTNVVTNASSSTVQVLDYYPYGAQRIDSGSDVTQREFIGQFSDEATSLSYLNARYYDVQRGQFTSQDPVFWETGLSRDGKFVLSNPQTMNSYSYSAGNPIMQKDPTGRCPICVIPVAVGFGAVGGFAQQGVSDLVGNYATHGFAFENYQFSPGKNYAFSAASGAALGAAISTGGLLGAGTFGIAAISAGGSVVTDVVEAKYINQEPVDFLAVGFNATLAGATGGLIDATPKIRGRNAKLFTNAFFTGAHTRNEALKTTVGTVSGGTGSGIYVGTSAFLAGTSNQANPAASSGSRAQQISLYQSLVSKLTSIVNILKSRN